MKKSLSVYYTASPTFEFYFLKSYIISFSSIPSDPLLPEVSSSLE